MVKRRSGRSMTSLSTVSCLPLRNEKLRPLVNLVVQPQTVLLVAAGWDNRRKKFG
jgi:hypothetical protein